jgi:DNA repair photolyase
MMGAMQLEARRVGVQFVEQPCKTALNRVRGMRFNWSLNPYMGCEHRCTFCYVRAFEKRAERPSGEQYGRSVRVKINVADVLRAELARPRWAREQVVVGAATDPYQPAEGRYRLTRASLQAFAEARTPVSLITRGPMIVRDLDVLQELGRRAGVSITFSVPTLDPEIWRATEPGTAPPTQRLRALERLADAGIRCGVGMAPVLPGLSDRPEQIASVLKAARDSGAAYVWSSLLNLRPGTREHFLTALERCWPELAPRYAAAYAAGRAYLGAGDARPIQQRINRLEGAIRMKPPRRFIEPPPAPEQLSLPC